MQGICARACAPRGVLRAHAGQAQQACQAAASAEGVSVSPNSSDPSNCGSRCCSCPGHSADRPTGQDAAHRCRPRPPGQSSARGRAYGGHEVVRGRSACTIGVFLGPSSHMEQMVASRMVEWSLPMAPMTSPNLARTMSVPHVAWVDRLRAGQLDAAPPEKTPKAVSHSETLFHISKHGSVSDDGYCLTLQP